MRNQTVENSTIGFLNINILRNKHSEIKPALAEGLVDVLTLAETKIDSSFPDQQFMVEDYQMYSRDRNEFGGGVLVYVRSDLPSRRVPELESVNIETVTVNF